MRSSVSIVLFFLLSGFFLAALLGAVERSRRLLGIAAACLVVLTCIIVFVKPVQLPSLSELAHGTTTTSSTSSTAPPGDDTSGAPPATTPAGTSATTSAPRATSTTTTVPGTSSIGDPSGRAAEVAGVR